ncbi:MAG: hypothetical protein H7Y07_13070 [Pyrinomonadaceae bacterium]|nr:hypothetical protein [Sphingobacteriaceae bacterium]
MTSYEIVQIDKPDYWARRYFAIPIFIMMLPLCTFLYLKFLKSFEKKWYQNPLFNKFKIVWRILIFTISLSFFGIWTAFTGILATNELIGKQEILQLNAKIIEYRAPKKRKSNRTSQSHYITIYDSNKKEQIELSVNRKFVVGEQFYTRLIKGYWGILYQK